MSERKQHVGINLLAMERQNLLDEYDRAVKQGIDDHVQTGHGVSCEARIRKFLGDFLPKRYGVTKGYIITPELDYSGPLEEWDIIIYDALESPTLFVRRTEDDNDNAAMRGIPVECVRAVVEVKATFTKAHAKAVAKKLMKLIPFCEPRPLRHQYDHRSTLPENFFCSAIFFETKLDSSEDFSKCLAEFNVLRLSKHTPPFGGGLIVRSQNVPSHSGMFDFWYVKDEELPAMPGYEKGGQFLYFREEHEEPGTPEEQRHANVVSSGFSKDEFWHYMLFLVTHLSGVNGGLKSSRRNFGNYGLTWETVDTDPLFPPTAPAES